MRFALITIDTTPDIAGRALALRQLDFAVAAGAQRVIGVGNGTAPQMIALRHAAEAAGARFHGISGAHGLLGAVGTADELLVLTPGLLPESAQALDLLANGPAVLVIPAAVGINFGFERIDHEQAWAGALLMPGGLVERLAQLPPDFATAPALLRIALQGRVPMRSVPPEMASGGGWAMIGDDAAGQGAAWLKRHEQPAPRGDLAGGAVAWIMRRFGLRLLAADRSQAVLLAGFAMLAMAAIGLSAFGHGAIALTVMALAVLPARLHGALARLHRLPFDGEARTIGLLSWLVDSGLLATLAFAVQGPLAGGQPLFAPMVLLLAARLATPARWPRVAAWLVDRAALGLVLAGCTAAGLLVPGIIAASLTLMAGQLLARRHGSDIRLN